MKIYTANIGGNNVSVLDLTNAPRQTTLEQIAVVKGPEGIDLSPDGAAMWVAGRTNEGGITIIDRKPAPSPARSPPARSSPTA